MLDKFQEWIIHYLTNDYNHLMAFLLMVVAAAMIGRSIVNDAEKLKKVLKSYSTFIFTALAVVAYLLTQYTESESVDSTKLGGPEQFGQFGDYIGGILNPIFGFITVLLLLQTLSVQNNDLEHNKLLRNMEALSKLLTELEKSLKDKLDSPDFEDEFGKFNYRSIFFAPEGDWSFQRFEKMAQLIESGEADTETEFVNWRYKFLISELKRLCNGIISTQERIIDIEEFDYLKHIHSERLIKFLQEMQYYHLLDTPTAESIRTNYSRFLQKNAAV